MAFKVLAKGKDGFVGEDGDGGRHKLPHSSILGIKTRMLHTMKVVDEGADGSIVENDKGERRYIEGPLPRPKDASPPAKSAAEEARELGEDDPLLDGLTKLTKALMDWPQTAVSSPPPGMLLLKAATPAVGRFKGKKKPTGPALHKHGQMVRFRHGDVEGEGLIVGSGTDGVTVQTEDGREHQVRHDALLPPKPGEKRTPKAKPTKAPKDAKPKEEKDDETIEKAMDAQSLVLFLKTSHAHYPVKVLVTGYDRRQGKHVGNYTATRYKNAPGAVAQDQLELPEIEVIDFDTWADRKGAKDEATRTAARGEYDKEVEAGRIHMPRRTAG